MTPWSEATHLSLPGGLQGNSPITLGFRPAGLLLPMPTEVCNTVYREFFSSGNFGENDAWKVC